MVRRFAIAAALTSLFVAARPAAADQATYGYSALRPATDASDTSSSRYLTWPARQAALRGRTAAPAPAPAVAVTAPIAALPPVVVQDAPQYQRAVAPVAPAQPARVAKADPTLPPPPTQTQSQTQAPVPVPATPEWTGVRAYSVVRDFGGQPDRIPIPPPTILAYSPEVAAAVTATNQIPLKDQMNPMSPADMDMLQQQQQEAAYREDHAKTRTAAQ